MSSSCSSHLEASSLVEDTCWTCGLLCSTLRKSRWTPSQASSPCLHGYLEKVGHYSIPLPFNLYKSFMSLSTSCLSSSFSLAMRSSHDSITTFSLHFSLQGLEQELSIKSMQEVEASILKLGIAQGIICFNSKESLVSLMLSNFNLSSSCSLLSKLNLHNRLS